MPEPDGPTNPIVSPRAISSEIPRKISTVPAFPIKLSFALTREMIGSVMKFTLSRLKLRYGGFWGLSKAAATGLVIAGSAATAEPTIITAFGDSLTHGYGLAQGDGFVPQLQAWLRDQGADVTVVNAGVSGDTTAGGAARIDWSLADEPDALIVALGGNDVLRGQSPEAARANLETILQKAAPRPVLLIGIGVPGNYGPDYKADFEAIYPALAEKYDTLLVDDFLGPLAAQAPIGQVMDTYMQGDGIHPNAAGVALIVEEIGPKVLQLIARAQSRG